MKCATLLLFALSLLISGCANPINIHTANKYDVAAYNAVVAGNWKEAQMYYSRAWINAKLGKADIGSISRLRYEYGRASGVVCDWEEAELALNEAYELDKKNNGPYWMSMVELERMFVAKKDYIKAKKYFDTLMPILTELQADTYDPLSYADILDEYAVTLENSGNTDEAKTHRARAQQLRETFPGQAARTEITPYGTQCKNEKNP